MNDISRLYDVLFETLQNLQDKDAPMDLDRAKAINETGQVIVNAAKTEIDFLKVTGRDRAAFFPAPPEPVRAISAPAQEGTYATAHGSKTVQALAGGTLTAHRLK